MHVLFTIFKIKKSDIFYIGHPALEDIGMGHQKIHIRRPLCMTFSN